MAENTNLTNYRIPHFQEFDATAIPFQQQVIDDIEANFDYGLGAHELLLSGAVGSAKSIVAAHCAVSHCLRFPRAKGLLSRRALPDLKQTIWPKILEQLECPNTRKWVKKINNSSCYLKFHNGSEIISRTWADKVYTKNRSLELSFAIIEEAIECDGDDEQYYHETKMRLGRRPWISENWLMNITNPSDPSHWLYEHFQLDLDEGTGRISDKRSLTKHVYYSCTDDNPFLLQSYKDQLRRDYDKLMYERMGRGRWIIINQGGVVYYAYTKEHNFRHERYTINPRFPVWLSWDWNIADNAPMSAIACQFIPHAKDPSRFHMHVFQEVVVEGMRTEESCEEWQSTGLLDMPVKFIITGDAAGRHRDTRSKRSDFQIVDKYFADYRTKDENGEDRRLDYEMRTSLSNPPIRERHNRLNALMASADGLHSLTVWGCPTVDKAFRLTQLKKGGNYLEDSTKPYQHIGTACGYCLCRYLKDRKVRQQKTVQL